MKKFSILFFLNVFVLLSVISQEEGYYSGEETTDKNKEIENRWVFGGDIGLSFGTHTYIEVSPIAAYRFNNRLIAGPGIIYSYENYKSYHFESSLYGFRTIAMYSLLPNFEKTIGINLGDFILYSENQIINTERYHFQGNNLYSNGRGWIDNLLLGGGLYQGFGNRGGGLMILVLFDITQNQYYNYSNPVLKIGFLF
jgi:hypothetical protein